ncbi:hypothetical protein M2372_004608 [Chryseobacterium sp. BIGb0232]|nr:hypothetical protein [Chryseobacterium sp. BIGb0232]
MLSQKDLNPKQPSGQFRYSVLSHEINWVSPGIEPCSPVPQTGALPKKP